MSSKKGLTLTEFKKLAKRDFHRQDAWKTCVLCYELEFLVEKVQPLPDIS
jgi:hypothetical protein